MGRVKVWFWIAIAATMAEVALAILSLQRIAKLERLFTVAVADPTEQAIAAAERAGTSLDALAWPGVGATLLGLIAIIGWMHSGATTVRDGGLGPLRHSTGWAIGAWFVPFLNLVRVPQIAADLYRVGRSRPRAGAVIGIWWFFWLIDGFFARAVMVQPEPTTPRGAMAAFESLSMSYWTTIASGAATIVMLALITTGLGGAAARPRAPLAPAAAPGPALWGPPPGASDDRFGATLPDGRFGTPAPSPVPVPTAPPVGPPMMPSYAAPAPSTAIASPPAAPLPVAARPDAPPAALPGTPGPSPYPPAQTFYPE